MKRFLLLLAAIAMFGGLMTSTARADVGPTSDALLSGSMQHAVFLKDGNQGQFEEVRRWRGYGYYGRPYHGYYGHYGYRPYYGSYYWHRPYYGYRHGYYWNRPYHYRGFYRPHYYHWW